MVEWHYVIDWDNTIEMACDSPYHVDRGPAYELAGRHFMVPCGKCPVCKRNRINQWVFRLQQESKVSYSAHFVTLTYNTDHIPISKRGFKTLCKKDFQKYMKRLRKLNKKRWIRNGFVDPKEHKKLRYYAVGEYGSSTWRPHYHAIVFNADISDLEMAWRISGREIGSIHVGQVTPASIAYTAKYIDKEKKVPVHRNDDRQKEFSLMSKGLGKNYLTKQMVKYHKDDISRNYVVKEDGLKVPMPRYYKEKIFDEDERKEQIRLAKLMEEEKDKQLTQEIRKKYGDEMSIDRYKDLQREGRFHASKDKKDRDGF